MRVLLVQAGISGVINSRDNYDSDDVRESDDNHNHDVIDLQSLSSPTHHDDALTSHDNDARNSRTSASLASLTQLPCEGRGFFVIPLGAP